MRLHPDGGAPQGRDLLVRLLLEHSAAIDGLNDAAVSGPCRQPHDAVARLAQNGAGSLYGLVRGAAAPSSLTAALHVAWFGEPQGLSYDALFSEMEPWLGAGVALWRRQMALGPPPEFGLMGPAPDPLPPHLRAFAVRPERVWPPS